MAIEVIETQVFDSGEQPMAAKHKGYDENVNNNSRFESMIKPIEADIPDPVSHSVQLGRWDKIFSWIMTFTVVPIKIICALFWLFVAWLVCLFVTKLMPDEVYAANTRCYTNLRRAFAWFGKLICWSTGLSVTVKGKQASRDEAPIIVVAPHTSFYDAFIMFWAGIPMIVSRTENDSLPFVGRILKFGRRIAVSRDQTDSKRATVEEILRRTSSDSEPMQLLLFPEGTTTNGKALMPFKLGAFYPGLTVQPVLVRYKDKTGYSTWTWDQPHSAIQVFWLILTHFVHVDIEYLRPYTPDEEERADPELFAKNVQAVMGKKLGLPVSSKTFADLIAQKKQRISEKKRQ